MKHLHIQVPSSETEEECVALLHLTLRHLFLSLSLCHSALVYSVGYVKADPDATRCVWRDTHTQPQRTNERKKGKQQTNKQLSPSLTQHLFPISAPHAQSMPVAWEADTLRKAGLRWLCRALTVRARWYCQSCLAP